MADRPILFSAPMVRALLDGRKTQTRRLFKPRGFAFYTHPISGDRYNEYRPYRDGTWDESRISGSGPMQAFAWGEGLYAYLPYAPGDRLWVREAWRTSKVADELKPSQLVGGGYSRIWYELDRDNCDQHGRYRHARFMPRWASRLTLTVTDVRVQRLQDISEEDAIAEGIQYDTIPDGLIPGGHTSYGFPGYSGFDTAISAYSILWNSINGAGSWEANPWIVAVSFEVHHSNIARLSLPQGGEV